MQNLSSISMGQAMSLDAGLIDRFIEAHPYPVMFVTMSGAHLYGFASADSDYDLRGCHVTPVRQLCRLSPPSETYELMDKNAPIEMDVVTHDIRKFFTLLLKNNGYVLEQVCSPLVARSCDEFEELRSIVRGCITRNHRYHYLRFGQNQWDMVIKSGKPTVKGLLYTYRVILAGIHLMRTHEVEANLPRLNETFRLSYIDDLIASKTAGDEYGAYSGQDLEWHSNEFNRLCTVLDEARAASTLPEEPIAGPALDDLLVRMRLKYL